MNTNVLKTKKFQMAIVTMIVAGVAKLGLNLDPVTTLIVVSGLLTAILGQGIADHGKSAAEIAAASQASPAPAPAPAASSATVKEAPASIEKSSTGAAVQLSLFLVAAVVVGLGFSQASCGAAQRVVDEYTHCVAPDAGSTLAAMLPLAVTAVTAAVSNDGTVDWNQLEAPARVLKTPAERCLLATALAELTRPSTAKGTPQSSPLAADPERTRAGFTDMSARLWGGQKFEVEGEKL